MVAASFQSAGLHETAGSRRETGMLRLQQVLRMMLVGLLFLQRVAVKMLYLQVPVSRQDHGACP